MALSLRDVVHTRYGLAGSFSLRNDVLSRLPHDVNYRTAGGKVSLRLILTPPIPPVISSFTASRERVPVNDAKVTLAWDVRLPTAWLSKNTFAELNHSRVDLRGQKDFTAHFPSTTYELVAYVHVPGGRADTSKKIVVNVDAADLSIINTWIEPTEFPRAGQAFRITFAFGNFGSAATGKFTIRIQLDGGRYTDIDAPSYAPGARDTVFWDFPNGLPAGSHYFYAYLDVKNQVTESNKSNNIGYHGFSVGS